MDGHAEQFLLQVQDRQEALVRCRAERTSLVGGSVRKEQP